MPFPRPNHTSRVLLYNHKNTTAISVHLRLNNMPLNNQWIKQKVKRVINLETNENITYQSLWETENTVQRRKFMAVNDYIKLKERNEVSIITLHFRELRKEKQSIPKVAGGSRK